MSNFVDGEVRISEPLNLVSIASVDGTENTINE